MKNKNLLMLFILITFAFFSIAGIITNTELFKNNKWAEFNFTGDYKSSWRKVDSLEQKGLTRSALGGGRRNI